MTRIPFRAAALALTLTLVLAACGSDTGSRAPDDEAPEETTADAVRLNQIQVIGSHNSYRILPSEEEQQLFRSFSEEEADKLEYEHLPLAEQFGTQGVRQIELDVFLDRDGGLYTEPAIRSFTGKGPHEPEIMDEPGFKVFHVQDVDYASTCLTLEVCLTDVRGWSDANPDHVPIAVLIELKDTTLEFGDLEFTVPELYEASDLDDLDAVIRSVFPDEHLITPDDIRGDHDTLEEAVLAGDAWPTIEDSRGKILFLMDNDGHHRDLYIDGHPNLEGRVLFTTAEPGNPDAAFIKMNDAFDTDLITERVRAGYVVRTRADGDTTEARTGDTAQRDAALESGAQWVSTDYPVPDMAIGFESGYVAAIPGGHIARCNPVNAPDPCVSDDLDQVGSPGSR